MLSLFSTFSLISLITTTFASMEVILEDEYIDSPQCVSDDIPMMHWPYFERSGNDLILTSPDTALTFNAALSSELFLHFGLPGTCSGKSRSKLYLMKKNGQEIELMNFVYYYTSEAEGRRLEFHDKKVFVVTELNCNFGKGPSISVNCQDKAFNSFHFKFSGEFNIYKNQVVLKYVSESCPVTVTIQNARIIDRPNVMQRVVTTTPAPVTTTTVMSTEAITTPETESLTTEEEEEETTAIVKVKAASSVNKVIIAIFSVVGILLLLMACGVGVYFVYTRFFKKEKAPVAFIPSSRSMPVTVSKTVTMKTEPSKQKTAEAVMNPNDEDKTQSLSLRPLVKVAISPAIRTETQVSSVPTPAEPTQSSVVVDKSVMAVKTAIPKTEKEVSKTVDMPPLVIEKNDNYTKIKKADFERGHEDSMASEEGCGPNIHKLEPLVMVPMTVADPSLEQYPAEYVEKMALRKATITDRAALHSQAVVMASNYLLKKGFKNNGTTLTGSDQLMDWLKTKSAFVQFVAECVEVRPDVTSLEFNASKIQWRRYLKKIDLVETYRQSCWIGQSSERREFFLLATFFKLEQLAQQYSDEDLKMYPFPVPYLLEVRSEAPHFFKIEDTAK
uniref:ZP domain-containing protein n=1 Tax=Panagrellus redivivus TaxID=6233 RepID=A0A7E4V7F7_PANRE